MNKWTKLVLGSVVAGMVSSAVVRADDKTAPTDQPPKKGAKAKKKGASCKGMKAAKKGDDKKEGSCKGDAGCSGKTPEATPEKSN